MQTHPVSQPGPRASANGVLPRVLVGMALSALATSAAFAGGSLPSGHKKSTPVQWAANGHYYAYVTVEPYDLNPANGITWDEAKLEAESLTFMGVQGHLATMTSAAETQFLVTNLRKAAADCYWLGGFQAPGSPEPAGGWQWVTGEAWSYTNWEPVQPEPNNGNGDGEDKLTLWRRDWRDLAPTDEVQFPLGVWNDEPSWYRNHGYVVEFPVPAPGALALTGLGLMLSMQRRRR